MKKCAVATLSCDKLRDNWCAGSNVETVGRTQHGDLKNLRTFPSEREEITPKILGFRNHHAVNMGHAAGGAVSWGTALQAGKSRVRIPMAYFLGGKGDWLTTLPTSTSWNPQGLFRTVMGLLFLSSLPYLYLNFTLSLPYLYHAVNTLPKFRVAITAVNRKMKSAEWLVMGCTTEKPGFDSRQE